MKLNIRICAAVLLAASLLTFAGCKSEGNTETTAPETAAPTERIEKKYDEDGIITNEYCYLGDELQYSIDYVYDDVTGTVTKIKFDGEPDESGICPLIESERFEVNELGELKYYCKKDRKNVLITETEYVYYDDLTTVWKETKKDYNGTGGFTAEKKIYGEDGRITDLYLYEGNKETAHTVYSYDENGNRTEETK